MRRPKLDFRGSGFGRFAHDMRHRRHRFRQALGVLLLIILTIFGRPLPILLFAGAPLVVLGLAMRLWASGHIKKDKELASDGPYALVRHPLYLGNFLISVGFVLAAGLWWGALLMAAFWVLFYPPAIRNEDDRLKRLFGEQWDRWSATTPAMFPAARRPRGAASGGWSLGQSLRVNGEPLIAVVVGAFLVSLYLRMPGAP